MTVLTYKDYKAYIKDELELRGHGSKKAMATQLGCQSAYLTQVLSGASHLSLEQAMEASEHFSHSDFEAEYFFHLIQWERAGTQKLKKKFSHHLQSLRKKAKKLKNRVKREDQVSLSDDDMPYYSSWIPMAVRALISLEDQNWSQESLAERLQVSVGAIETTLDFLKERNWIQRQGGQWRVSPQRFFLPADHPMILQHHSNWRSRAQQSILKMSEDNLHYSALLGMSFAEADTAREILTQAIGEIKNIAQESESAESIFNLNVDHYSL